MVLNSLALYVFCGASTHSSASVVYTINLAVADMLVALSLPARIALYHSGGRCVACSYVHTFSYFVNMYCSILFLTRWVGHSSFQHFFKLYISMYRKNFFTFTFLCDPLPPSSQHLYRSLPRCRPCLQYSPSLQDHGDSQVCQRHSLVHCSCGYILFPGEDTHTTNTTQT